MLLRRRLLLLVTLGCYGVLTGGAQDARSPQRLAAFTLTELFGVAWPSQPIEFRYDGGRPPLATTRMTGPDGREVPYQWVSSCSDETALKGCILVRGDLPAKAHQTWTLEAGVAPSMQPDYAVKLEQTNTTYQLTNGLIGIRILAPGGNPKPWNRAPVQGILLPDGKWTGVGSSPNLLYAESPAYAGIAGAPLRTPMSTATSYLVTLVDSGPLKTTVKAEYAFQRPRYRAANRDINPAGPGHYTVTVTMYAGSKSVVIDEDSDMMFSYYLPLYAALQPDRARYRGQPSPDPVCGYEPPQPIQDASNTSPIVIQSLLNLNNGQRVLITDAKGNTGANGTYFVKTNGYPKGQFGLFADPNLSKPVPSTGAYAGGGSVKPAYRGNQIYPLWDATMDITYSGDRPANYICTQSSYRRLLTAYPPAAGQSAPWYMMLYNSSAGSNAPVVGFYVGRPSEQYHSAIGPSQPGPYSSERHFASGTRDAGIEVDNLLLGPDARATARVHRNWAIWVSRQSDLLPVNLHQPIEDEQNALGGINLSHVYRYQLTYPDPPGGWKWLYLSPRSGDALVSAIRNGTSVCGAPDCFSKLMYNSDTSGTGRALNEMWRSNTTQAVQKALDGATRMATQVSWNLAHGSNHFDRPAYYELGLNTIPQTAVLNAVLVDSNSTPAQKATAKAALALFGCIFWDNDWFPIDNDTGEGVGLSNQVEQYLQYRTQSVAAAPSQPFLASKLPQALKYAKDDFDQNYSPTGANPGSTHYASAFFEPLILNFLSFSLDGKLSMSDPKWLAYANWELSIQTPPEPRFGNLRKVYSNGDGNTEADVRTGMLANALYAVNPTVAGNLMWAWQQSNSATTVTEDVQFTTTLYSIDAAIPRIPPTLASINIPGYHTAERHFFGTPYETVLWFIDGGFYSAQGHRHFDDGQISIYAHSAPLAIDWNANLYNPSVSGRFMHNSIVLDTELKHPWSADNPSLHDAEFLLRKPTNTEYAGFKNSTTSTGTFVEADGTIWTRTARLLAFDRRYPVIYVTDSFSGPGAAAGKTLTWNLMANGPVVTPSGPVTPAVRFSSGCQNVAGQLPSSSQPYALPMGLERFSFTGASWPRHATGGIDWDLFILPTTASAQFTLGNWGHGCHPAREMGEFQSANGMPFSERQDILRIHDNGPFTTLILPFRKSEPPVRTVTMEACGIRIAFQNGETMCFNHSLATFVSGSTTIVTVYDDSKQTASGVTLSGGPQELALQPGQARWTISGAQPGARTLTLPGNWAPKGTVSQPSPGVYAYDFPGALQAAPVTITFVQ